MKPTSDQVIRSYADRMKDYHGLHFAMAWLQASLATCPRKSVGCVIVDIYGSVLSTGYNGAPYNISSCLDRPEGCILEGGHCVSAVHAEIRAIANAARRGISLEGSTAYCTLLPCINCFQAMTIAGVNEVQFDEEYDRPEKATLFELARNSGPVLVSRKTGRISRPEGVF